MKKHKEKHAQTHLRRTINIASDTDGRQKLGDTFRNSEREKKKSELSPQSASISLSLQKIPSVSPVSAIMRINVNNKFRLPKFNRCQFQKKITISQILCKCLLQKYYRLRGCVYKQNFFHGSHQKPRVRRQ